MINTTKNCGGKKNYFSLVSLSRENVFCGKDKECKSDFFQKLCISESFKILYSLSVS